MIFSLLVLKKYKDQNKYCSKFYYVTERTKMIYISVYDLYRLTFIKRFFFMLVLCELSKITRNLRMYVSYICQNIDKSMQIS